MKRFVILCWLAAGSITALILFQIKQEVRDLEQQISTANGEILRDQEALHILEAEWSFLNNPARIAALAERHLGMGPIPAERIVAFDDLPLPGAPGDEGLPDGEPPRDGAATLVKASATGLEAPSGGLAR
jgi:cell division protein FtsL